MQITYICVMRFRLFVFILFIAIKGFATHNRAGYISYTWIGGNTYKFRIYTYTNPTSYLADRCEETLMFTNILSGHNIYVNCPRVNSNPTDLINSFPQLANCTSASPGSSTGQGEGLILVNPFPFSSSPTYGGVKVNIYEGTYTFGGAGTYVFGMVDPNLDRNVVNVGGGNSQNVAFALIDTLRIGNFTGNNNTPLVSNPPIDNVCYHQQFCYNPGMVDPDHDSLAYSLISFTTGDTTGGFYLASGSFIPPQITVDQYGNLCWSSPWTSQQLGEYDVDILIREYRAIYPGGPRYEVGSMIFAVQLLVVDCPPTTLSLVASPASQCVDAGSSIQPIVATATASSNPNIDISASGLALTAGNIGTNASFPSNSGFPSVSSTLNWTPSCQAVSLSPYYFTIQAHDNATGTGLNNATYTNVAVQVVSPAVQNLTATVLSNNVQLSWSPPSGCSTSASNTDNPITEYIIYRINNCVSYQPPLCKTGVPASSGYVVIGTCTASPYYDTNNGQGLPPGNSYSYIVIAKFADGSLSMAPTYTPSMCITLHFGVPIITNVSVDTTDTQNGSVFIRWQKPLTGGVNFDTLKQGNIGPYYFSVQKLDAAGTYTNTIYTSPPKKFFGQLTSLTDTTYIDTFIDTKTTSYKYKIYFFADTNKNKGSSAPASSVFLTGVGHDKKVVLNWISTTPWHDTLYYVYKKNYSGTGYTLIDSTHRTTDTIKNLTNGYNYCFKIRSVGTYQNFNIISPLYNFSERVFVKPIDDLPPCQPKLSVVGDCNASINKLTWVNPSHICNAHDVSKYYIYYTPRKDSVLTKIDSVLNANDTTYITNVNTQNIAGCYVIVAVDTVGNQSPLDNEICTDNCPEYELPNIFTPNSDSVNDLYVPVKNRYIQSVDFTLYNRWGEIVYENTNPALGWDGKSKQMKQPVPDGVYFYTCTVNERHFYGIKEIKLKGFVQVIK
ncbi:MAG: gliding motility-associated C-terminal domain-containing protein [Bacteroidia bacterium]